MKHASKTLDIWGMWYVMDKEHWRWYEKALIEISHYHPIHSPHAILGDTLLFGLSPQIAYIVGTGSLGYMLTPP